MKRIVAFLLCIASVMSLCQCALFDTKPVEAVITESRADSGECKHEYKEEVVLPQCKTDGYTKHLCSLCGNEYISDIVFALGHVFSDPEITIEATCQNAGEMARSCSVCGYRETESVGFSTHRYKELGKDNGNVTYQCEVCQRTVTKAQDSEVAVGAEKTLFDCEKNQSVRVSYHGDANGLKDKLDMIPLSYEGSDQDLSGSAQIPFSVDALGGGEFVVKPTNGFEEGGCYVLRLKSSEVSFVDYPEVGRMILRVKAEEKFELEVNEKIKFIKALNDSSPGYYPYSVNVSGETGTRYASLMKIDGLNVGDVVCLGEYSNMEEILRSSSSEEDYCFGTIERIYPAEVGYVLVLSQTGAKDIYKKADVNLTTGIVIREEELTEVEKASFENAAFTAVVNDEDFVTYLAATERAAVEYMELRGLKAVKESNTWGPKTIGGFQFKVDYSFDNSEVKEEEWEEPWKLFGKEYKYYKAENGTKIKVAVTVSREFKAQTSSGADAGVLDVSVALSFVCEPRVHLQYVSESDLGADDFAKLSAELVVSNEFELNFKVHAGIDYSLENKPFVYNQKTGTYHCAYCRIVEKNESSDFQKLTDQKFISDTKDLDEKSKVFCGICKPQTALKNDYLMVNETSRCVHIPGCGHITDSCISVRGLASRFEEKGYELCGDCDPAEKQTRAFKDIIDSKIKSGGLEEEVAAFKKLLKGCGAVNAGTSDAGSSLIKIEVPVAAVFKLMLQVDLVFDFDLNATILYTYKTKNVTRGWVEYTIGQSLCCGKDEQRNEKEVTQQVEFTGTARADLGLDVSIGVAVVAEKLASVKMTLSVGAYAKLNGMAHYDIKNSDWHGGAYFEAGTYLGVNANATILWNGFSIPVVEKTDTPFFKLGYDEIWVSFITTPTTAQMQGDLLVMEDEDYLKIKTYDLTKMKSGERVLSLSGGSHYDVDIAFGHGTDYLRGNNGVYKVADGVKDKFIETVTVSVEGTGKWNDYKEGQAVVFLEPYTFTVEFTDTFLLDGDEGILGTYKGSYFATQGETGLTLTVYKEGEAMKAIFDFYNLPGKTNAKSGKYYMNVSYDANMDEYLFVATEWIERPDSYLLVDLKGKLVEDTLSGDSPTSFSVTKIAAGGNSIPSDAFEYNGHYYKVFSELFHSWEEAKAYCESLGGHLAVISSKEENDVLFSYVTSLGYQNAYFGYTDNQEEGSWYWSGDDSTYTNWHQDEPNSQDSMEDYAMFYWKYSDGTWNDGNYGKGTVSDDRNFICEWDSAIGNSIPSDTFEYNGHSYQLLDLGLTWNEAKQYCEERGGHLLTITDREEQDFITSVVKNGGKNCYWLGATLVDGKWTWISGETFDYINWVSGEPNNMEGRERYIHIFGKAWESSAGKKEPGDWNDVSNEGAPYANDFYALSNFGFICEWERVIETTKPSDPVAPSISEKTSIEVGDYVTMGTYYGEPIVWRCVAMDENGPLMVSDKILCFKAYDAKGEYGNRLRNIHGSNHWETSTIRHWLNADGWVDWSNRISVPDQESSFDGINAYDSEKGFLTGFTEEEKAWIKQVRQKTYLNNLDSGLAEEGISKYDSGEATSFEDFFDTLESDTKDKWCYYSTDKIFLLGPEQAKSIYMNFGEEYLKAKATQAARNNNESDTTIEDTYYMYFLRLPANRGMSYENVRLVSDSNIYYGGVRSVVNGENYRSIGIRPAFYLNEEKLAS